jgi:hypothetical protein
MDYNCGFNKINKRITMSFLDAKQIKRGRQKIRPRKKRGDMQLNVRVFQSSDNNSREVDGCKITIIDIKQNKTKTTSRSAIALR